MKRCTALLCLACLLLGTRPVVAETPIEVTTLLQKADALLANLNPTTLAPFTEGDSQAKFHWMQYTRSKDWHAAPLLLPATEGQNAQEFAVFHRFNSCESAGDHLHRLVRSEGKVLIGEEIPETETFGYRITHHKMGLTPNMTTKSVQFTDRFTLEKSAEPTSPLVFTRLLADYKITAFTDLNGKNIPYWRTASLLIFPAPKAEKSELKLVYSGSVNHDGSDYILENEMTLNSYWYPVISRLPSTLRLTATAPKGYTALTHGEIVENKTNPDGTTTLTFENKIPICYFTFDMGKYHITHIKKDGIDLYAYLMGNHTADKVQGYLETASRCLQWFGKHFAPYPYTRYTLVETLGRFGGALEGYSFATFQRGALGATVHEISHTWWGGIVPCTYLYAMWNESFANYSDDLFERQQQKPTPPSEDQLLAMRKQFAKSYSTLPVASPGNTENGASNAVGYGKGSQVMRVLEEEIGQEAILKVCQGLIQNHKPGSAAEWADVEASVNRVTGKDYRWFFEQWLERVGVPQLRFADVKTEKKEGKIVVSGAILQTGKPYQITVPLLLYFTNTTQQEKVAVQGERTEFRFEVKAEPKQLRLDPNGTHLLGAPDTATEDPCVFRFAGGKRQEI